MNFKNTNVPVRKSKTTAALLAIFLGIVGAHFFYLRMRFWGVIFILLSIFSMGMLTVPFGIFAGLILLLSVSDEYFDKTYNKDAFIMSMSSRPGKPGPIPVHYQIKGMQYVHDDVQAVDVEYQEI